MKIYIAIAGTEQIAANKLKTSATEGSSEITIAKTKPVIKVINQARSICCGFIRV